MTAARRPLGPAEGERMSTVAHCAGGVYPSDHFPVVAELRQEE